MILVPRKARDAIAEVERIVAGRYVLPLRWRPPAHGRDQPPAPRRPDAYLSSFAKSGRTWIAFAVANYLRAVYKLELALDMNTVWRFVPDAHPEQPERGLAYFIFAELDDVPLLAVSHAPLAAGRFDAPVTLLLRDPRAVLVSYHRYVSRHLRRRDGQFMFEGKLLDFLRSPDFGPFALSRWLDTWASSVESDAVPVTTYERWHQVPECELASLVKLLGREPDPVAVRAAVTASRFDQMLASELASPVREGYDTSDPDARHVRRGRVDGWRDEISDAEEAALNAALAHHLTRRTKRMLAAAGVQYGGESRAH